MARIIPDVEIQINSDLLKLLQKAEERIVVLEAALKDIYNDCNCLSQDVYDEIEKVLNKK